MNARRCPRCTFTLVARPAGPVTLDACPRCHGVFVERHEGRSVLGPYSEPSAWASSNAADALGKIALRCPSDDRSQSHGRMRAWRVRIPSGDAVEVDACNHCGGLWLDAGEAQRLQAGAPPAPLRASSPVRAATLAATVDAGDAVDVTPPPPELQKTGVGWYLFQLFTAMPLEVYNPKRRAAVVCLGLIIACVAVFGVELWAVTHEDSAFIKRFAAVGDELFAGRQLHTVITHMFLHGGAAHLLGNMWFLWTFGDNVEDRVGRGRFLALFIVFGVTGMVLQVALMTDRSVPLLGASGAIAGLMGAYLALFPKARLFQVLFFFRFAVPVWLYIGGWALLNVGLGVAELGKVGAGTGVAWWAHVGGFGAGLVWALIFGAAFKDGAELRR